MSLFPCFLLQPIFLSYWLGFLQPIIPNYVSWFPYYILVRFSALNFGSSLDWCLGTMWVFIGTQYFVAPFLGIIYFGMPLSLCANDISLQVTYLGVFPVGINSFHLNGWIHRRHDFEFYNLTTLIWIWSFCSNVGQN